MDAVISSLILFLLIIIFLAFFALGKMQTIATLNKDIDKLNTTINELKNQTKLIIKNDMELKLYQEEVEDKIVKLTLLKNLILSSLHTLDYEELFYLIDEVLLQKLGFKKGIILNFDDLTIKRNIHFSPEEVEEIKKFITAKKNAFSGILIISENKEMGQSLKTKFKKGFFLSPIMSKAKPFAIFMVADAFSSLEKADEEFFSILCMYLGQCLDNIKLFEELYYLKDELEKKVREKTHELLNSLRKIEAISKKKSDFISSVSHELRTPLTSVKGFSSLLVQEKFGELPPQAKERLQKIDANVDKLVSMVNTLLDISRIEAGKMEVKIAPSDIVSLINEVADSLYPQMEKKQLHLFKDLPLELFVYMDRNLIERVLINLINNAIKFTPEGGKITISCRRENQVAIVSVKDTGYGINKDNLSRIFDEFYREDNPANRTIRGSGLGLSLVKRIINTHKEKIWVESEEGKGSTFYFTLRVKDV